MVSNPRTSGDDVPTSDPTQSIPDDFGDGVSAAPNIPDVFLAGDTSGGLERIRTRLLDLTNRNRLLNFRPSKTSSLQVVNVQINPIFTRLRDGDKLGFMPVPEPEYLESLPEGIPAKDKAALEGWDTSIDLDEVVNEDNADLPVLHYQDTLDTVSRKIASAAKTVIEESGVNMLYLVFGFLEWYESDDSDLPHLAPLLVVPVSIERVSNVGRSVQSIIEYSGDDIGSNLSLVEKMRRDFGVEIPLLDDDDTPEDYFKKFSDLLDLKKRWKIRRRITLTFLSFGKLLMYRDLDPTPAKDGQSIANHHLVRELFEGTKDPNVSLAEEYPIDDPDLKKDVPLLIRDADSSQHSALIHALRGKSLVIEGPPGTGKSQTITNLIAAALARGKKVLFVSEKLAALEVVRSRLDDAGLGIFCLELHSHKTKKGALLNDIAQRCNKRGTFRDPGDLNDHLATVEQKKLLLTKYASLINKTIEPIQASIFEILWTRDRSAQAIHLYRDVLGQMFFPHFVKFTKMEFAEVEQLVSIYAQTLSAILETCDSLDRHPWIWIAAPLGIQEEELIFIALDELLRAITRAEECQARLDDECGFVVAQSAGGLEEATKVLDKLPEPDGSLNERLLAACTTSSIRGQLSEFASHLEDFRNSYGSLTPFTALVDTLLDASFELNLTEGLEKLRHWRLERCTPAVLRETWKIASETARLLSEAHSSFRSVLSVVDCDAELTLSTVTYLLEFVKLLEVTPFDHLHLRNPVFEGESIHSIFKDAKKEADEIKKEAERLGERFDLPLAFEMKTPARLVECAAELDSASFWQRLFGGDYRRSVKTYTRLALDRKKARREHMSGSLRELARHAESRSDFANNHNYRELLGMEFRGLETPWENLESILGWYGQVLVTLPGHRKQSQPFRDILLTARVDRLRTIQLDMAEAKESVTSLRLTVSGIGEVSRAVPGQAPLIASGSFEDILKWIGDLDRQLNNILQLLDAHGIRDAVTVEDVSSALPLIRKCRHSKDAIEAAVPLHRILGDTYQGVYTDVDPVKRTVAFAEEISGCDLPEKTSTWLLCEEYKDRLKHFREMLGTTATSADLLRTSLRKLDSLSQSSNWTVESSNSFTRLREIAERAKSQPEALAQWNSFLRLRIRSNERGIERLTRLADSLHLPPPELGKALRFVFYNSLCRRVFVDHPELEQTTGITQEQLRSQFGAADRASIRLYSERVASIIDKRPLPSGRQSGPVRDWTDMALVYHEINKQKRHIPIRQLIRRASSALIALKPCFMMGPLSVAQYLEPGTVKFDLVVMDEASQLKPEDAIGAISRGAQVVIVGDPKQLPPTTFFQRSGLDTEDGDNEDLRTAAEDAESILDVASTLYQPVRRLRWHYRSRHHSLIAFSNEEFYNRDLIIFPTAYHDDPSLGIKYKFVADGQFEQSRNTREAAVVAEAVLEHMRQNPDESLGVVTLNFEQCELVEELLDRKLREDPAAMAFQEKMQGGQNSLFVKNLENVQGDERDVIFISTTYGPDTRGNQYQRFGPINNANGHRRLNVLFTRAKKRVEVFSSLDPDRIQTTSNSPWGVRALKQYLTYARSGILQQAEVGNDQPTNDFERSVGSVVKELGFEVTPQVGVAGFFIDLGVKHPTKPGMFMLGIECDGAGYHSGKSARDRDRLRQEILENLGWKIYRIWSTDWYRNREGSINKLKSRIQTVLESDTGYRQHQAAVNRGLVLRQRLEELLKKEINPEFPDTPAEKGLLSPQLLDFFIERRPKTKDEWFRRAPLGLRLGVDSRQVAKYLDRVFEIIAEE
jgi:very-short-patch-repair endonuclease